jgi:hypothetical protein
MKNKNIITTITFACLILVMSVLCIFNPAEAYSQSERRDLASFPELNASSVATGEFMKGFETYTTDRFPYRDNFRGIKTFFATKVFQKADNNGLYVKDGHISKIEDQANEEMMDYAADRFNFLAENYLKDSNIYFSIVPDKNYFLGQKYNYPYLDYQKFSKDMQSKFNAGKYIDITGLLSADDYYKTDTHWKQECITDIAELLGKEMGTDVSADYKVNVLDNPFYGVYYGQLAIPFKADTIKYLTNSTLDNCKVTYYDTGKAVTGDLYSMEKAFSKDPYEMFLRGVMPLVTLENANPKTDKNLIVFRDSFGSSLAPLLLEGYNKITVVDIRYVNSAFLGNLVDFSNADALFIYSTTLLNNSLAMK